MHLYINPPVNTHHPRTRRETGTTEKIPSGNPINLQSDEKHNLYNQVIKYQNIKKTIIRIVIKQNMIMRTSVGQTENVSDSERDRIRERKKQRPDEGGD